MSQTKSSVKQIDHVWIPLSDGTRLAAGIWLPEDATEANRVPAVLEYLPYRKNDLTAERDSTMHPVFAEAGYASVRVDLRGCGDSDGVLEDEYLAQEQADAVEVIAWLAEQPWCTGKVGMIGISWGGFNGLQVAAENPPGLAGVISIASTDDRYSDDVHYMGGAVNAWDQVTWGDTVNALAALPPSSRTRTDWRETWLHRLENVKPIVQGWMSHQSRDAFWRHGSVIEDYDAMTCPIFMVGGWNDAYRDSVFRVLEGYSGESRGLIGPWAHTCPDQGVPGPAIDFCKLAIRWWDYCLKGKDNGVRDEPQLQAWMQDSLPPEAGYAERSGEWVAFDQWPPQERESVQFFPSPEGTLVLTAGDEGVVSHHSNQAPVANRGNWCPGGWKLGEFDLPGDQQDEDAASLSFTSDTLETDVRLLGKPEVTLRVSSDKPQALIAVRLVDVSPSGSSTLVSRGFLNLSHRESHESPVPLIPGTEYTVTIPMQSNGYRFASGHRIRLAIHTTYWPWVWPSPEDVTISVRLGGGSSLSLPLQPVTTADALELGTPPAVPSLPVETVGAPSEAFRRIGVNESTGAFEIFDDIGAFTERRSDNGLQWGTSGTTQYVITEGDPLSAKIVSKRGFSFADDDEPDHKRVEVMTSMSSTAVAFTIETQIEAYEAEQRVLIRNWSQSIPRNNV